MILGMLYFVQLAAGLHSHDSAAEFTTAWREFKNYSSNKIALVTSLGGGTDLKRGYGDVQP